MQNTSKSNMRDLESKTVIIMEKAVAERATMTLRVDIESLWAAVGQQLADAHQIYLETEESIRLALVLEEHCEDSA